MKKKTSIFKIKSHFLAIFIMSLSILKINAQNDFITKWNLATPGSGLTQLTFTVGTSGTVNYTWESFPNPSLTGSGTFTGTIASITGLPFESTILLKINPTNFKSINVNGTDSRRLIDITQWGTTAWTSTGSAFQDCSNLTGTATDTPNLANVTDMSYMFANSNFTNPSIGNWDVSSVTNMSGLFNDSYFNQNIGNWNVSNVSNMSNMFGTQVAYRYPPFNQNISNWNVSKVTDMSNMFNKAYSFNQDISSWNISSLTGMTGMFSDAWGFNQNISAWASKLNPNVDMNNIRFSGFSGANYDAFLTALNSTTIAGRNLGAFNLYYCNASAARANLLVSKGWTFTDKGQGVPPQIITQPTPSTGTIPTSNGGGNFYSYMSVTGTGAVNSISDMLMFKWSNKDSFSGTSNLETDKIGIFNVSVLGACGMVVSNNVTVTGRLNSINESIIDLKSLSIFPNPSEGVFTIENNSGKSVKYAISDVIGKEITNGELQVGENKIAIAQKGIYFLQIGNQVKKLMVE